MRNDKLESLCLHFRLQHSWFLLHRRSHSFQHLFISRKAQPILLGDHLVSNPDSKLAPVAFDQFCLDVKLFFEQVRHTGGARFVVSNHAVAYGNRLHYGNLL